MGLTPGLTTVEVTSQEQPIQGISTSIGAFVGVTQKGAIGQSILVTSWQDFVNKCGGFISSSYLAYAVRGFFDNGGRIAYISRVVHFATGAKTSLPATITVDDASAADAFKVDAESDGVWGNALAYQVSSWNVTNKTFTFTVFLNNVVKEQYNGVTLATLDDLINGKSLVKVTVLNEAATLVNKKESLTGGNDGLTGLADEDYIGSSATHNGLYAFDNDPVRILAVPGITSTAVLAGLQTYVDTRKDCFAVGDIPLGSTPTTVISFKETLNVSSERVGLYYPWINVSDPIGVGKSPIKMIPPSGHIAGIFARIDTEQGVFKAPAGTDAVLQKAISLEYVVNDEEQALINPIGVNAIRVFAGTGIIVWGARCSDGIHYVPVRRSADFVEQSIMASSRWAVFQPNNEKLWLKIDMNIRDFLRDFWEKGGLFGETEEQAFYVICDDTINNQETIDNGETKVQYGLAQQKPSEFIEFEVGLK